MDIEGVAASLADRLVAAVEDYRRLKSDFNNPFMNFRDIEIATLVRETAILTYSFQRVALMFFAGKACLRDESTRRRIAEALDGRVVELLAEAPEFYDLVRNSGEELHALLDARGKMCFQLMQSHMAEIKDNNWAPFCEELRFKFEQCCRGGGGEDDPLIIGNFTSMLALAPLATQCWTTGYADTVRFLREHDS